MDVRTQAALICFGGAALLIFLFAGIPALLRWQREVASRPRVTVRAEVISRVRLRRDGGSRTLRQEPVSVRARMNARNPAFIDLDRYLHVFTAVFALESGESVTLRVPGRVYDAISKGQTGRLTYQGSRFIHFEEDDG